MFASLLNPTLEIAATANKVLRTVEHF
jgi:hypothetical protein